MDWLYLNHVNEINEIKNKEVNEITISISSNAVRRNQENPELRKAYENIISSYPSLKTNFNPTIRCSQVEESMYSWIGFQKYAWMPEEVVKGKLYPKVAVQKGANMKIQL